MITNGLPGQRDLDVGEMLANPDSLEVQRLTPETLTGRTRGEDILDVTDRLSNQTAITEEGRKTIGERIGSFLGKADSTLENPDVIRGLAAFGTAFAQGRPNEPGTILGQFAMGQADRIEGRAEKQVLGRLLAGEDISDIEPELLSQLSAEGMQQAEQIRSGRAAEGLQQQGLAIDERLADLRAQGLDLERVGLENENRRINLSERELTQRINNAQSRLAIDQQLANSLGNLRDAQAEYYRNREDGTGGASADRLFRDINEATSQINEALPLINEQLQFAERDLNEILSDFPMERGPGAGAQGGATVTGVTGSVGLGARAMILGGEEAPVDVSELPPDIRREYQEAKNRRDAIELQKRRYEDQLELLQEQQQELLRQRLGSGEGGGDTATGTEETTEISEGADVEVGTTGGTIPTYNSVDELENANLTPGSEVRLNQPGFSGKIVVLEDGSFDIVEE